MKRLLSLLLALIGVFALAACAGNNATSAALPDSTVPWAAGKTDFYERSTYSVVRKTKDGTVVATGEAVFTVRSVDEKVTEITETFTITYNDVADEADRGKTDIITSVSRMNTEIFSPVMSEKTVELADRTDVRNDSYRLTVDYTDKKSELVWLKNGKEASTIDFSGESLADVYDNETLYYVLRGFKDVKAGGSSTFNLANFFDMHVRGNGFAATSMKFTCAAEGSEETLNLADSFKGRYGLDEVASVKAIKTSVSINATESGAPIDIYYSLTPLKIAENETVKRPLVAMKTYEYDYSTASIKYTTEFSISDYSRTPPETNA